MEDDDVDFIFDKEFEWLSEKDENIDYVTEAFIREDENDDIEVGISVMVNAPCEIVFTISDLRKIIELIKDDE